MEFCGMKREIDRKCLNHARVHANAQSFDRCECAVWMRNAILGNDLKQIATAGADTAAGSKFSQK